MARIRVYSVYKGGEKQVKRWLRQQRQKQRVILKVSVE
jgi:hypothetical protein